jgi:hypothetical protein
MLRGWSRSFEGRLRKVYFPSDDSELRPYLCVDVSYVHVLGSMVWLSSLSVRATPAVC